MKGSERNGKVLSLQTSPMGEKIYFRTAERNASHLNLSINPHHFVSIHLRSDRFRDFNYFVNCVLFKVAIDLLHSLLFRTASLHNIANTINQTSVFGRRAVIAL